MPDQEQFETGRSIRTLERGGKDAVIVLGVSELRGLDGDDSVPATYQIADDGQGLLISVVAKRESEVAPRNFDVYFDKNLHLFAIRKLAQGAPTFFTCAPSPFHTYTKSAIPAGDFWAVVKEYGGCHIDISSDHRLLIKRIFGV